MSYPLNICEEELKARVGEDYFSNFDATKILGNIDFCVSTKLADKGQNLLFSDHEILNSLLWAESKKGKIKDLKENFVQLILTIGKAKTYCKCLPPKFLGAFDAEKIAFIEYHLISDIFVENDFNWNVTPSEYGTQEFVRLYEKVHALLEENSYIFRFGDDDIELKKFISTNFRIADDIVNKIKVDKNNFTYIYLKWCRSVKPSIAVNWEQIKKTGLIDADFFLADLLSEDNRTIREKLFVLLHETKYIIDRQIDENGLEFSRSAGFNDNQKAHKEFWKLYQRPPKQEYWEYIVERRDLLVPQDIRERKGTFFTPQIWVEKSQQYLADVLGEDWQDEYYLWDCCAGTGNLLDGLTNARNIWASTLDNADVEVMKDRIQHGWNMFEDHVFQFDFLNDDFSKCPVQLQEILKDEEKRKKLVIYINPPYAEAATTRTKTQTGSNKKLVARDNRAFEKYGEIIGGAGNELFALFLARICKEISGSFIGQFSTLKTIQAPNFSKFRIFFVSDLKSLFVVPSDTFDNVKGKFPIGFYIWKTDSKKIFKSIKADVYDKNANFVCKKLFFVPPEKKLLMDWLKTFHDNENEKIAYLRMLGSDFQNNGGVFITVQPSDSDFEQKKVCNVTKQNFLLTCIYFAVRLCIPATWLNDRDQFLYPNDGWQKDTEFQSNCLIYTLFNGQNRISSEQGTNHWIPFTERQVGCKRSFQSHFMSDFLHDYLDGKVQPEQSEDLFAEKKEAGKVALSAQAQAVYDAGLELWKYYHSKPDASSDASFYDIRKYFQGVDAGGRRMNSDSSDETYTALVAVLRGKVKSLAKAIEPKVYEYGFLK